MLRTYLIPLQLESQVRHVEPGKLKEEFQARMTGIGSFRGIVGFTAG